MTEGSHTYCWVTNNCLHNCAPGAARRHDEIDVTERRPTGVWVVWSGVTKEWSIEDRNSAFLRRITFCPFCGTELPQPPRVVSGSWQEWDEVREAIAYAESKGHQPPALIGKIMTAADWSQQPEPPRAEAGT